jgi:hypothetical protein
MACSPLEHEVPLKILEFGTHNPGNFGVNLAMGFLCGPVKNEGIILWM